MIAVICTQCRAKLTVQDVMAGKRGRCPQCKQAIEVPVPTPKAPLVSAAEDETVPPAAPPVPAPASRSRPTPEPKPRKRPIAATPAETVTSAASYRIEAEIARGGMGAVMRAVDPEIRREVAVKFLLNHADERQKARFVEEAQITGQLEHPNIVPIHQLGVNADGRCFFSMKMVKGRTLADIIKDQAKGERVLTLSRMLNLYLSICNALGYAHSQRVIHRDLKPANIMVGDFGELYVMDWGLAKVLGNDEPRPASSTQILDKSAVKTMAGTSDADAATEAHDSHVRTNRAADSSLTQDGAILGTPAYMPPEQARGDLAEVDERSDIYALGAILYEIMTWTPPVGRGGDPIAVLMRVTEGAIDPPDKRAPERARAGWTPSELSAIAMKALAKDKKDRYANVEELKHDIELFLEGRSVSAKQDTAWEMLKKLVKRNKGLSIGLGVAMAVLLGSLVFVIQAWRETGTAYAAYLKEQDEKNERTRASAPAFLRAAQLMTTEKQFDDALAQTSLAIDYHADLTDAYLLKGQLLIALDRYQEAAAPLETYLRRKPTDELARQLLTLAQNPETKNPNYFGKLNQIFQDQRAFALAGHMTKLAEPLLGPLRERLPNYKKRIDAAWPGLGNEMRLTNEAEFSLNLRYKTQVVDLEPLKGLPLSHLDIRSNGKVKSIEPLRGMPLRTLDITAVQVGDLSPLKGAPLRFLDMGGNKLVESLEPLRGSRLDFLHLSQSSKISDLSPLQGMPIRELHIGFCNKIASLEPLRGMPLENLDMGYLRKVTDLEPLQGMPLKRLAAAGCDQVKSLAPLQGMPLESLNIEAVHGVNDLEPLRGMPLQYLNVTSTNVHDLAPLEGMPLTYLALSKCTKITDFSLLKTLPLKRLYVGGLTKLPDLECVRGLPLETLHIWGTPQVSDLTPLEGMNLKEFAFSPRFIKKGLPVLKAMKSLETIHVDELKMSPEEFWKRSDAGEFTK